MREKYFIINNLESFTYVHKQIWHLALVHNLTPAKNNSKGKTKVRPVNSGVSLEIKFNP
ncbi:unnamed protein product, partial [Allacma fusca]